MLLVYATLLVIRSVLAAAAASLNVHSLKRPAGRARDRLSD